MKTNIRGLAFAANVFLAANFLGFTCRLQGEERYWYADDGAFPSWWNEDNWDSEGVPGSGDVVTVYPNIDSDFFRTAALERNFPQTSEFIQNHFYQGVYGDDNYLLYTVGNIRGRLPAQAPMETVHKKYRTP